MNNQLLAAFGLEGAVTTPLAGGLINQTFLVQKEDKKFILQRLSPIFKVEVLDDIQAVTSHLAAYGLTVSRLIKTMDGATHLKDDNGHIWRLLTFIPGQSYEIVPSPLHARSAGFLLGRYHTALDNLEYTFKHVRAHVHDTAWHFAELEKTSTTIIDNWTGFSELQKLTGKLLEYRSQLMDFSLQGKSVVHGDPKVANFLFNDTTAISIIDLDTFAYRSRLTELGDAVRSFAAPAGENAIGKFDENYFQAFISGYHDGNPDFFTHFTEIDIKTAARTITLELAARFAKEAYLPQHFAWDPTRYSTANDHNLARLKSQLALASSF